MLFFAATFTATPFATDYNMNSTTPDSSKYNVVITTLCTIFITENVVFTIFANGFYIWDTQRDRHFEEGTHSRFSFGNNFNMSVGVVTMTTNIPSKLLAIWGYKTRALVASLMAWTLVIGFYVLIF